MKIFSGGEKFTEQNSKIRLLLGEGTGGRKLTNSSSQTGNWREAAKQNIKDIAGGQKDSMRNYAYLTKFKESLDQRQVKNRENLRENLFTTKRSNSEDPRIKSSLSTEPFSTKLDITTKHLIFEQRRFSESRPRSASRPQLSERLSVKSPLDGYTVKQSKVQELLGSLQQSKTLNYGSFQDATKNEKSSVLKRPASSKQIKMEQEQSASKFDKFYATPASTKRPRTAKDRLAESIEKRSVNVGKSDYKPKNYLTPKAKLVFNKKTAESGRMITGSFTLNTQTPVEKIPLPPLPERAEPTVLQGWTDS
jgi:hypothetical protein